MQVFPAPHNAGELDETLTNEPCFLEYATCCFCPSPPTARASLTAHSYRYRNWRERPDANAQTSDSGVGTPPPSLVCLCPIWCLSHVLGSAAFIRERVCDASAAQWGFVLWVLIALLVFLLRPMTGTWTRYTQLDQLDHEL